ALERELLDGRDPLGPAGVSRYEDQISLAYRGRRPLEGVRCLDRRAAPVHPKEGDVEAVARELEVVRVTAERGHRELGREDQPHVLEPAVRVEVVLPAVEQ